MRQKARIDGLGLCWPHPWWRTHSNFAPLVSSETWTNGVVFGAAIPVIDKTAGQTRPSHKATSLYWGQWLRYALGDVEAQVRC